jgi:hypothetical protein
MADWLQLVRVAISSSDRPSSVSLPHDKNTEQENNQEDKELIIWRKRNQTQPQLSLT